MVFRVACFKNQYNGFYMSRKAEKFSKREQQIMDAVYQMEEASVAEIRDNISDPPSLNAVRTMVQLLEDKGFLKRRKQGREFVYQPKQSHTTAGKAALGKVLDTFFKGSLDEALAAHFCDRRTKVDGETLDRIQMLIDEAKQREEEDKV